MYVATIYLHISITTCRFVQICGISLTIFNVCVSNSVNIDFNIYIYRNECGCGLSKNGPFSLKIYENLKEDVTSTDLSKSSDN